MLWLFGIHYQFIIDACGVRTMFFSGLSVANQWYHKKDIHSSMSLPVVQFISGIRSTNNVCGGYSLGLGKGWARYIRFRYDCKPSLGLIENRRNFIPCLLYNNYIFPALSYYGNDAKSFPTPVQYNQARTFSDYKLHVVSHGLLTDRSPLMPFSVMDRSQHWSG